MSDAFNEAIGFEEQHKIKHIVFLLPLLKHQQTNDHINLATCHTAIF